MPFVHCMSLSGTSSMELPVMSIFIDMSMHIASPLKHMYAGMQTGHFDSMCYAKMAKREREMATLMR